MDAGEYLAVARQSSDGRIVAWGLGAPVLGANPPAVSAVTAGDEHISAILANGTVRHWGFVTTNWSQSVSATNIAAGIDFTAALRSDGTVVRWGGLNEMAVPTTIGPASALYAGGGQIAVRTMRTACDGCVPEAKFDCNNNGQEDTLDIAQGISRDVNQTRVPDECEFPMVRAASGALPVDLLLIADNSASMQDLPIFCSEVLTPVAQTLRNEFDLEVHWFDLVTTLYSQENQCPELDGLHLIQDTTLVPSCGDVEREVQSREDWGDGAALIADPNFISPDANNDGELDIDWTPRAAITIMVILSDEGAELGSDDSPCDDADYLATVNAASRSKEWGVVHVPVAFPDSTDCNYSLELNAPRLMNLLAEQTGGGVVDAQSLATPESRPTIVADMLSKIRAAIEASPRNAAACPADFNGDGSVTAADLSTVLGAWGAAGGDVNSDGTTNAEDLSLVLDAWGECP